MLKNYGCRYKMPHDYKPLHENRNWKWEQCIICSRKIRWNKGKLERIDNDAYLEAHIRNFAQRWGPTKELYMKLYRPEECILRIC